MKWVATIRLLLTAQQRGKASVKWGVYLCDEDVRVCYAVEGGRVSRALSSFIALTSYPSFALAFSRTKVILVSIE